MSKINVKQYNKNKIKLNVQKKKKIQEFKSGVQELVAPQCLSRQQ